MDRSNWLANASSRWGRGRDGDQELADAIEAAVGTSPAPMLRLLPVDLEELSTILEGDPVHGGGRIDLRTGEVWPQCAIEYAEEVGEIGEEDDDDPDRWLWVDSERSRPGYRDMEWFVEDLEDAEFAERLARSVAGDAQEIDRRATNVRYFVHSATVSTK